MEENKTTAESASAEETSVPKTASDEDVKASPAKDSPKKSGGGKKAKSDKADKSAKRADAKEKSRLKKEWEDSIVASKRVKREEVRRKVKQATVIMLVFALIVTSVVYIMLLFVQENNVRITASSKDQDKVISLSIDNSMWTPYLNANGPDEIWDVSYSPVYGREVLDTVDDVKEMLNASTVPVGEMNGKNFIRFLFMVKNTGKYGANISYEMTLDYDNRGLQNAVRVMWGQSFKSDELTNPIDETSVEVYASRSNNPRLANTNINVNSTPDTGYIEYVAYPPETNKPDYDLRDYELTFKDPAKYNEAVKNGYFATTPFYSNEYVFQRETVLDKDDIMYCYVCIWLEGSDFDCVNDALGGYVKLGINFVAY